MRPHLLDGGLDAPAAGVVADDLSPGASAGSAAFRDSSRCVPVRSRTAAHRNSTRPRPDSNPSTVGSSRRASGPADAIVRPRRVERVGLGVELADERRAGAVPAAEAGDLVGAVGRVAGEHEPAAGHADQEQPQQAAHDLGVR